VRTRTPGGMGRPDSGATWRWALAGGLLGLGLLVAVPALAQGGDELWRGGGCRTCHGQLAQGGGGSEAPDGPSLRRTMLDRDQLIETITCGRPGTGMPFNLEVAYREYECYGIPLGEPPPRTAQSSADFTEEEVAALVDFLIQNAVGQSDITRESCAAFYGGDINSPRCQTYP